MVIHEHIQLTVLLHYPRSDTHIYCVASSLTRYNLETIGYVLPFLESFSLAEARKGDFQEQTTCAIHQLQFLRLRWDMGDIFLPLYYTSECLARF